MYHPISAPYEIDGKWILAIWVPGGETRPYKAKISLGKDAKEWAYYIRKQSSSVKARGADERELLGLAATVPFDDRYNQTASMDDLSPRLMESFLREVGSDLAEEAPSLSTEELGRQMNIVGGPKEAAFPKNVGLLFFNEQPYKFFPATQIDVVWFPEGAEGDQFEEKIFKGPIARMTREALDFIRRNYLKENVLKYSDRAEAERFWNFPYAAIEEAVVNAVYHRSYEEREPVEIRISTDDLTILSFPGPDRSISLEDLQKGKAVSRRYRNRRIGEFLKELELTEGRSTGIPKLLREMRNNGSPTPEFITDEDRLSFLVRLPIHPKAIQSKPADQLEGNNSPQVTPQVTPQVESLLKSLQRDMSRAAFKESISYAEQNLYSKAPQLIGDKDARHREFTVQLRAFDASKTGSKLGVAALVALCTSLLKKSVRGGLIIVGEVNLGGSIEPIHNPVSIAEIAVEKGATALLMPITCRRQLFDLSDDMATKIDIQFYSDTKDVLFKSISD